MPDSQSFSCLTDELFAELLDGRLSSEELSRMHEHADECPHCHHRLAAVVRGGPLEDDGNVLLLTDPEKLPLPETPAAATSPGWIPPPEFDEFRLVRPIGRGAMGVVYLAHDSALDRQVAVKFIASHQPHAQVRARFQNEARAIARLQHPNVVTVFRTGEREGHPYIVSEYLEGQSLAELPLPLPWRRALGLGIGLARGLAAAHRQGVLHRDIKPSNVLLTAAGEVKLLDFGLAELVDTGTSAGPNAVRPLAGTPRYMAPELFQGSPATPRSDIYALGLVLHELCTGTMPSPRHDLHFLERQQVPRLTDPVEHGGGPLLSEQVPGIDPDFALLIERCLRVDPKERYASAEALCAELERLHAPDVLSAGNPYRGLAPFEAEHRAFFFGRDADIHAVLERLRRRPMILVAGDSGVGKSSLCRAGILPRVVQGALDEYRAFSTLTLEPGRRPLEALAAALAPLLGKTEAEFLAWLGEEQGRLGPALRAAHQEGRGLLLFVDQLEELVTLSEPAQAERFARLLGELGELTLSAGSVRVLLAVRGDFLTRVGALPGLDVRVERALYLLRPLTREGVHEAIVGPARRRGVVFESIQPLVEATSRDVGSLPLLQFTLAELWERRDPVKGLITRAAIEETGGVAGALSRHADAVLARLTPAEQQAARRLFGCLITADGTRSARSEEELTATSQETRAALRALIEGRLVHVRNVGGQASYELAHEALIASWGTLRQWLDEDAGQRALRQRIEASSAEWERLGRPGELLWRKRQLQEAQVLDAAELGPRERDFLRASMRAVRRQTLRRGLAVLLLVLSVGGVYGGLRLQEQLEDQRFASERLADAQGSLAEARERRQRAMDGRAKALALFDGRNPDDWSRAKEVWSQALEAFQQASTAHLKTERALDDTLERVINHPEARELRIALTHERILLAEAFHQTEEHARLAQDFERLTARDSPWRDRLKSWAEFELETTPPGARVELSRYEMVDGVRRRVPVPGLASLGTTPLARVRLEAGSYHLHLEREGHAPVDLPLLLERGKLERLALDLPTTMPQGYVYIPPGCFLMGSGDPEAVREFMHSVPLHPRCLSRGYLIGRYEVTLGDWLEYLDSGQATAAEQRLLATPHSSTAGALSLRPLSRGSWRFSLHQPSGNVLTARDGEPLRYPSRRHRQEQDWRRFPLTGVSAEELSGYLAWLDRTGRLPGARLCTEHEWTRAARGADGRRHPHGDRLQKDDANIDETYDRRSDDFGPDEVGAHPASVSPFGLHDMAGNAFEITQASIPDLGDFVILGGAWYFERIGTFISNRQAFTATARDVTVGVRLCASVPAR